ncbi:MAG TPA: PBP1A family penicillin-binding protein [Vicinamibacterales bacterium]|nr:PBP1A family penicillin-binding protein [Vicinamibacterales bacterium]
MVRILAALTLCLIVGTIWFLYQVLVGLPGRDELRTIGDVTEGTTVYDLRDRPVFSLPTQYRIEVPIARISPNLKNAVVAVEDSRFYKHDGVDGVRIIGAVIADIRERRKAEGASTITQQLARMSFLSRDKTFRRKVREAILAQRLEKLYSKDEILEFYLNKAYFGDGLYGAEAAARGYFGKSSAELTPAEGAMLAGVLPAPSTKNPVSNPQEAVERRNVVLKLMLEHDMIADTDYRAALEQPVVLHDSLRGADPSGVHFKELVRRELIERFGKEKVYQGRLRVYATIDPDMQKAAEDAVAYSLREIEARLKKRAKEPPLQAALIALDPATGEVRAIVGGRDTQSVGLNRALQTERQPGSAFKPFVYAAALESGYAPASVIDDLNIPVEMYKGAWLPEDEHSVAPSMTMRTALRTSSNRAAVRMLETVGIERTVAYAERLGVGAMPSVPSLALGSGEVTLSSMTSAYAAFAQGGIVRDPVFVKRVEEQDGTILFQADAKPRRAISETTAFLMVTMLADVIDSGTGSRARALGFTLPAAGKTGTTNDFVDAWFVGFTPKIVAGVWVGFDQPRPIVKNGFAGLIAVPMWARFMKVATRNDGDSWFDSPADVAPVEVCRLSGHLPGAGCSNAASISPTGVITYKSMIYTDYFVRGTEPQQTCAIHAVESVPYPEPSFAEAALNDLGEALGAELSESVVAPPPPVRSTMTPMFAPSPSRQLPDLPVAPPEPPPEASPSPHVPASNLPPPAAPEAPPLPPQ